MTDKKRLEEAKLMAEMLRVETRLPHDFPFDLVDWLVEQAERVQELEQQNKRYKQALEFYADEETYETKFATDTDEICDPFTLIELDEGKKYTNAQIIEVLKYIKYIIENVEMLNNALDDALRVKEIEQQNKRYREAIERALDESGWGDEGNALYKMISILAKALEDEE